MRGLPKIGTTVVLPGEENNPKMVITNFDEKKNEVTTTWFSLDRKLNSATFSPNVLEKVKDDEIVQEAVSNTKNKSNPTTKTVSEKSKIVTSAKPVSKKK